MTRLRHEDVWYWEIESEGQWFLIKKGHINDIFIMAYRENWMDDLIKVL